MTSANPGARVRYNGQTVGSHPGIIATGTVFTVREVVAAGDPGAGGTDADSVVVVADSAGQVVAEMRTQPVMLRQQVGTNPDGTPVLSDVPAEVPTPVLADSDAVPQVWSVPVADFERDFTAEG